jgi:hypothetical protein
VDVRFHLAPLAVAREERSARRSRVVKLIDVARAANLHVTIKK